MGGKQISLESRFGGSGYKGGIAFIGKRQKRRVVGELQAEEGETDAGKTPTSGVIALLRPGPF